MGIKQSSYGTPREAMGAAFWEMTPDRSKFIGNQVLAEVRSTLKAAKYLAVTRESISARNPTRRSASGEFNRIDTYLEDKEFSCEEWGLEGRLPDSERIFYASEFDAEQGKVEHIYQQLMLDYEIRVATAVFNTTTWTGADLTTDVSAAPWSTAASDVIGPILDAAEKVRLNSGGETADTLVIGAATLPKLLKNTGIIARFPGAPLVTAAMLFQAMPAIFGLDKLLIGKARYNTADEGQTYSGSDVWSGSYAMVCKTAPQGASIMQYCIGRTIVHVSDTPDLLTVDSYYEDKTMSEVFRVRHTSDEVIQDAYAGHLLKIEV